MSTDGHKGDVVVVILGGGRGTRLDPLTRLRSKPAVPIAGKFRLIDVPISNAIHSGMERMFVLTQFNSVSLHRHIAWTYQFDTFSRGFCEIVAAQQTPGDDRWFQGTADAVRQNLGLIEETPGEHVLILSGDHMYRMDYHAMLQEHVERDADVTLAVWPCTEELVSGFGAVRVGPGGRVVEFREKPADAAARAGMQVDPEVLRAHGVAPERMYIASMGIYLFRKEVLIEQLAGDLVDFGKDILPRAVDQMRVQSYLFDGYWRDIGTIRAFYEAHMDLVRFDPEFDFHDERWPFYTHPRYLPPARITGCRFERSMLAEGARIQDCHLEDAVIGVRSRMLGATVRRSLIMGADDGAVPAPEVGIGPGSVVQDAIVDKNARIGRDVRIVNADGVRDGEGPGWVIRDGIVVVAKNAVIPDGTVI